MSRTAGDGARVTVRPLRADEAEAAAVSSAATFDALDVRLGYPPRIPTEAGRVRRTRRVAHLQSTDPEGAWAAEVDGRLVGVALSMRREQLWFLSLLTVEPGFQGAGAGRRLLEAALTTAADAGAAWIMSSPDPRALRRYGLAGFELVPAYSAEGPVDRARLPAVPTVRTGDWACDGALVDDVVRGLRGAGYGPDLEVLAASGDTLLIADGPAGRGFCVLQPRGVRPIGATSPEVAQQLLWAGLAECGPEAAVEFVTGEQGWATRVLLAAGLPLWPETSCCHRGRLGPHTPFLPSGSFG